ncbi:MAG TPA: hypothetical protein VNL17_11310 [Verrucomicrobiae bacterium]|nr:hypothetical protein [Verrucomicrobiae bacterium]
MKPVIKRILIGMAGPVCVTAFGIVALIVYMLMPPLRSFARMHEKLPSVSIESGKTVYCRMQYCDFRFPLPDKARVMRTGHVTGGFDTIEGTIYVVDSDGTPVSLRGYAELLQKNHFHAVPQDKRNYFFFGVSKSSSDGGSIDATITNLVTESSGDDGSINATVTNLVTEIHFSYFGDY